VKRAAIDTHALVWHLSRPKKLGASARRWLRDCESSRVETLIPAAVPIELALLRDAGRRVVGPPEIESLVLASASFKVLPLDLAQAREFVLAAGVPELFDRLMVAAARALRIPLITADPAIVESGLVEVVWD
jgi:PIN domain nuclease of toxin-antitoxin system